MLLSERRSTAALASTDDHGNEVRALSVLIRVGAVINSQQMHIELQLKQHELAALLQQVQHMMHHPDSMRNQPYHLLALLSSSAVSSVSLGDVFSSMNSGDDPSDIMANVA